MNVDFFTKYVEAIHGRLHQLYRDANSLNLPNTDLLPVALKELGIVSEELQVAVEELTEQTEELLATREYLEIERQRYQDLFEFAPDAYLVTDLEGKIREANRAACHLLNISQKFIIGKSLIVFIAEDERWTFRRELNQQRPKDRTQEFEVSLQPREGEVLTAALRVTPILDRQDQQVGLRWLLRDISQEKQSLKALSESDDILNSDRRLRSYAKGEIIPLDPQVIWLVKEGLVKLSTITENGEEVLVGFAGPEMVFGSGLTSLQAYQARALSRNVELVAIFLSEMTTSPKLAQTLFSKISQRLKQTECILAISGHKLVKDRLHRLLLLLQQQIGENVPEGTRLTVRLTHEDFASACCTTRVTITRLLSNLQQEGKIIFDYKSHMIIRKNAF